MSELNKNTTQTKGKDAITSNIQVAKTIANIVRTTLGPKGMDKILVDSTGKVLVTNDGVTILSELGLDHPVAQMMVSIANTQEEEVGDGTTSAVILAGALLDEAEKLFNDGVHPSVIVREFMSCANKIQDKLSESSGLFGLDKEVLAFNVAVTAMTGKGNELDKVYLAKLLVDAMSRVDYDVKCLALRTRVGCRVGLSKVFDGLVLDVARVSDVMPKFLVRPKIGLLDAAMELDAGSFNTEYRVSSADELTKAVSQEHVLLNELVNKLLSVKADIWFTTKGVHPMVEELLLANGVVLVRRVHPLDIKLLSKLTGARVSSSVETVGVDKLGSAKNITFEDFGSNEVCKISLFDDKKFSTILLGASTQSVLDEVHRVSTDVIGDLRVLHQSDFKVLPGAGATELMLAEFIRKELIPELNDIAPLIAESFARALEVIPKTLLESSGANVLTGLYNLRAAPLMGVDVMNGGRPFNVVDHLVFEPLILKSVMLSSAVEVACSILRVDDVILSNK